ncbi:MAG: hypothetical protein Q4P72_06000, partial [Eubacteriales bacterium]|nr:hypothetical protein [Eubacteriales bacterium]
MRKARRLIALLLPVFMILGSWMQTVGASEAGGADTSDGELLAAGEPISAQRLIIDWELYDIPFPADGVNYDLYEFHPVGEPNVLVGTVNVKEDQNHQWVHFISNGKYNPEWPDADYSFRVEDSVFWDIRLEQAQGTRGSGLHQFVVVQNTMSLYKSEWHDHYENSDINQRPNIEAAWYNANDTPQDIDLSKDNTKYFSTLAFGQRQNKFVKDPSAGIMEDGVISWERGNRGIFSRMELGLMKGATKTDPIRGVILDGTEEKREGKLAASGTTPAYFFKVFGDHKTLWRYALWEVLDVKFNSGEGKLTADGLAGAETDPVEIGYDEKFTGNESGRSVDVPTVIPPEGKKLIGWKADNKGEVISSEDLLTLPITASTVFYAVYDKDDSQFINITANTNDPANSVVLAEENPIEVAVKSTWADIKSVKTASGKTITDLVTPNPGYAIYQWLREEAPGTFVPLTDATVFEDSADVIADVKKVVLDEEPTKPEDKEAYVKVSFKSDAAEATENGGYFGTAEEKHEEINKWVLKNSPRSVLAQPTPVANVGFTFNAWDPAEYPTTEFTTDETYTATWTKLADIIGPVDPTDPEKPEKPAGYVTVSFLKGANGTLSTTEKTGLATVEY